MATLVCRLAGPLQAWSTEPRFNCVSTGDTPSWSGLLGLARAALGHGRDDDPAMIAWLRSLTMAVRIDQPGHRRLDYHSVNPLPAAYRRFVTLEKTGIRPLAPQDLVLITTGKAAAATGRHPAWNIKGVFPSKPSQRAYLHDAAFLWLVHGDSAAVTRLAHALTHPRWTLYLGRKSCPPASPLVLGIHPGDVAATARTVPVLRPPHSRPGTTDVVPDPPGDTPDPRDPTGGGVAPVTVPLIMISPGGTASGRGRSVQDNPLGSHPQQGYATNTHHRATTTAPTMHGPWHDLLAWAETHLDRPHLEPQP